MKRILSFVICLVLICSFSVTAFAAGAAATLSGVPSELKNGATATVTVSASGTPSSSSALVQVTLGDGLELVSGEWKKDGVMKDFTVSNGYGVLALSSAGTFDGTVFSFVVKGKTSSAAAQNITVALTFKNGSSTVGTASVSKSVKVVCATHTYNAWTNDSTSQHKHTCTVCGYEEKVNHTWNGGTVTKQATCKEAGNKKYTCTACGAEKNETIAKTTNHTYGSWTTTKEATCTDAGTQTRTCSVCGKNESRSISAKGHNWSGYKVTKEPTCTAAGTQTRTCSVCGKTESQSVPATGHSYGAWSITKEPTCTEKGIQARKCSKCGATETKDSAALGHSFSHPTVTKQPTCTETGIETGTCVRCNQTTSNPIKAVGHKFGDWVDVKAATCTEKGTMEHKCSVCDKTETKETDALGHDFENATVVQEPTISSTGLKEGKCKRCGETTKEVLPCMAKDETTGILLETEAGVFREGTRFVVEEIKDKADARLETIGNALREVSEKFVAYDISTVLEGAKVQPNGKIKVTFRIPDDFSNSVKVFFIHDNGTAEEQESEMNDDRTVTAELTHFSTYVLCDMGTEETGMDVDSTDGEKNPTAFPWVAVGIVAVIAAAGAVAALLLVKKKKSKTE